MFRMLTTAAALVLAGAAVFADPPRPPSVVMGHRIPGPRLIVLALEADFIQVRVGAPTGAVTGYSLVPSPGIPCTRIVPHGAYPYWRCSIGVPLTTLVSVRSHGAAGTWSEWVTEAAIYCRNDGGQGCPEAIFARAPDPPAAIPANPASVSAAAWGDNLTVNWLPVWNATSYKIETSTNGYTWALAQTVDGKASWASLLRLEDNTAYQIRVRSANSAGTAP